MIKKNWVWIVFAFAVVLFCIKKLPELVNKNQSLVSFKTFQIDSGWGYDIYKRDSIYIHQIAIPAVSGRKVFKTEADAKKVANLVVSKINKGKLPTVSLEELQSFQIN